MPKTMPRLPSMRPIRRSPEEESRGQISREDGAGQSRRRAAIDSRTMCPALAAREPPARRCDAMRILHLISDFRFTGPVEPVFTMVGELRKRGLDARLAISKHPPE